MDMSTEERFWTLGIMIGMLIIIGIGKLIKDYKEKKANIERLYLQHQKKVEIPTIENIVKPFQNKNDINK